MIDFDVINVGTAPNDDTGDDLRDAFIKANDNFAAARAYTWRRLKAGRSGADVGSFQNIFDSPESITLPTGTYISRGVVYITGNTGGSLSSRLKLDAGTATLANPLLTVTGAIPGEQPLLTTVQAFESASPTMTAGSGSATVMKFECVFEVSATGTFLPQASYSEAGVFFRPGTYIEIIRLGDESTVQRGWA